MNRTAKNKFDLTKSYRIKSESFLSQCIQEIARKKWFTDEEPLLLCGLDIMTFETMTKEQIVEHFEKHNEL